MQNIILHKFCGKKTLNIKQYYDKKISFANN
jgi:hypothetical protein